jgi:hypothetical protein
MDELWTVTYYGTNADGVEWRICSMGNQFRNEAMRLVKDALDERDQGHRYGKATRIEVTLQRPGNG